MVAWLDYGGLFVFALSGASLAAREWFDVVGLVVLAEVTAIGGGVLRDLIIGAVPPAAFTDTAYVAIPLLAATVVFVFHRSLDRIARAVLVFDAAGLAFYCVAGAGKAMAYGWAPCRRSCSGPPAPSGAASCATCWRERLQSSCGARASYMRSLHGRLCRSQGPGLHG